MQSLTLFIDTSLEGDITKPKDDFDFLTFVENEGKEFCNADFIK